MHIDQSFDHWQSNKYSSIAYRQIIWLLRIAELFRHCACTNNLVTCNWLINFLTLIELLFGYYISTNNFATVHSPFIWLLRITKLFC